MRPGLDERREFEYKRHGTLCLIANLVERAKLAPHHDIPLMRREATEPLCRDSDELG